MSTRPRARSFDASDLTGRRAVVTGAGSGIGRSLALLAARRGAEVHVVDVDTDRAETVAGEARRLGATAHAHTVDVADADAVLRLADEVFAAGPVDLLCNNAGVGHAGAVVDTTLSDWRRLVDINLLGVVHGLNAFLPRMTQQQRPSHVLNTASMAGLVPNPGLTPYSATKYAVVGLTEGLALELAGTTVGTSALCPGIISTDIIRTSTMRGDWAERRDRTGSFYATRGTSPDVVARQAFAGITRGRTIIPSPRYQVTPPWLLKRWLPPVSRALSVASSKFLSREG